MVSGRDGVVARAGMGWMGSLGEGRGVRARSMQCNGLAPGTCLGAGFAGQCWAGGPESCVESGGKSEVDGRSLLKVARPQPCSDLPSHDWRDCPAPQVRQLNHEHHT